MIAAFKLTYNKATSRCMWKFHIVSFWGLKIIQPHFRCSNGLLSGKLWVNIPTISNDICPQQLSWKLTSEASLHTIKAWIKGLLKTISIHSIVLPSVCFSASIIRRSFLGTNLNEKLQFLFLYKELWFIGQLDVASKEMRLYTGSTIHHLISVKVFTCIASQAQV